MKKPPAVSNQWHLQFINIGLDYVFTSVLPCGKSGTFPGA